MEPKTHYIGMDVHKKSIEIAIAESGREGEIRRYGEIPSTMEALDKVIRKLQSRGRELRFVYEAGPNFFSEKYHSCLSDARKTLPTGSILSC